MHRVLASLTAATLAFAIVTPADADEAPVLTVSGVVATLADHVGEPEIVIIAGSSAIEVAGGALEGIDPGTRVEAELAIPSAVVEDLNVSRDVSAETELGAAVIESADAPLQAVSIDEIATAAAPATGPHYLDVAINTKVNDGTTQPSTTQVRAALQKASDYFVANTGGVFPGFEVRNIVRYSSSLPCGSGASDFDWADDAAQRFGNDLAYYFERPAEHVVLIGECRHDAKAAVGSIGAGLGSGGFIAVQSDFFSVQPGFTYADALDFLSGTVAHEFGHNFGLTHANAPALAGCTITDIPLNTDITTCGTAPYADDWSVMGYAVPIEWVPVLDIARKEQLGLTTSADLATQSSPASTTYTLKALGGAPGLKGVKIVSGSETYYVEYRDGSGEPGAYYMYDGGCTNEWEPSATCSALGTINPDGPGVRILRLQSGKETRVAAVRTRPDVPTFAEFGLDAGDSWKSASGLASVTINSATGGQASITVTTGSTPAAAATGLHFDSAPVLGVPVTAVVTSTTPAEAQLTYRWFRGAVEIPGANSATYTPAVSDAGLTLTVRVTASAAGYLTAFASTTAAVTPAKPVLSGPVKVGVPVSVVADTWPDGFSLSYQWLRDGSPIGAYGTTYVPTTADYAKGLSVRVFASHSTMGSVVLTSAKTTVAAGTLSATTPAISGSARVGYTLTAVRGTWTAGTTFKYRWYANGVAISGATAKTYTVPSAMIGKKITVKISGSQTGYAGKTVVSAAKGVPRVGTPSITGTAAVGRTLTAKPGTWTTGTAFTYQWYASGVAIPAATGSSLALTTAQAGKTVTVKVTGTKSGYTTVTATSKATAKVAR